MAKCKTRRKVILGYRHDVEWDDHIITWREGGKLSEPKSAHADTKADAIANLLAQVKWGVEKGCYDMGLSASAQKLLESAPRAKTVEDYLRR